MIATKRAVMGGGWVSPAVKAHQKKAVMGAGGYVTLAVKAHARREG
jgi:hypothetical protein